jgi:tetratricopeptide (TPR) repeat protein
MSVGGRRLKVVSILLLVLLVGPAAYLLGLYSWGNHHIHAARAALDRRDFRQADTHLQEYLDVWPDEPTVRLLAAQSARRQGEFDRALEHLRVCRSRSKLQDAVDLEYRLIRLKKGDLAEAGALLAQCASGLQDASTPSILEALIEGSLQFLTTAATLELLSGGELVEPYMDRTRRAVDLWLQLRPGPPDQAEGLVWRGQLEKLAKQDSKALADFREALELRPDHFDATMHLAMHVVQADPGQAIVYFERLRREHPENNLVRFSLASSYRGVGRLEEAQSLLDDMLASNPDDVPALIERGYISLDRQQVEDAEHRFRKAIALAPVNSRGYLALSCCLQLLNNETEAKQCRERFQQLEADHKRSMDEAARQFEMELKRTASYSTP